MCYLNQQVTCILEIYGIFILKIISKYLPVGKIAHRFLSENSQNYVDPRGGRLGSYPLISYASPWDPLPWR